MFGFFSRFVHMYSTPCWMKLKLAFSVLKNNQVSRLIQINYSAFGKGEQLVFGSPLLNDLRIHGEIHRLSVKSKVYGAMLTSRHSGFRNALLLATEYPS